MVTVLDHPLLRCDISTLRSTHTQNKEFRSALNRIGTHLSIEACKDIVLEPITVTTPLEETVGYSLDQEIVVVPILRAGISLLDAFLEMVPDAKIGYIGLRRNEETLEPLCYYDNIPACRSSTRVFLLDPMIATGGSIIAALTMLKNHGAHSVTVLGVLAAPEGIQAIERHHPSVKIVIAALDRQLNEYGYIVPGLGDAGDRAHGT